MYRMTAYDLATRLIHDVLKTTGITATAGIGTNLYLSKVAMDIVAKKCPADSFGVRIAELNEQTYRRLLWNHQPLTSFWRIGKGYAKKAGSTWDVHDGGWSLACLYQSQESIYCISYLGRMLS